MKYKYFFSIFAFTFWFYLQKYRYVLGLVIDIGIKRTCKPVAARKCLY